MKRGYVVIVIVLVVGYFLGAKYPAIAARFGFAA